MLCCQRFGKRLRKLKDFNFVAAAVAWIVDPTKNPPGASNPVIHGSQTSRNSSQAVPKIPCPLVVMHLNVLSMWTGRSRRSEEVPNYPQPHILTYNHLQS